jgi:hypothetical protein
MVWWIWFGRQRPAWIPRAAAGLALLYMISQAIGLEVFFGLVPHGVAAEFEMVSLVARVLFFALMLWIVIQGIRSQGLEGRLVLPAILLRGISTFTTELRLLHIRLTVHLFGTIVNLSRGKFGIRPRSRMPQTSEDQLTLFASVNGRLRVIATTVMSSDWPNLLAASTIASAGCVDIALLCSNPKSWPFSFCASMTPSE